MSTERSLEQPDEELAGVLDELGIEATALIARGGEAAVYRYGRDRIARISHRRAGPHYVAQRGRVLEELAGSADRLSFAIPRVLQTLVVKDRVVTVEPWIAGQTLESALAEAGAERRQRLSLAALEGANELRSLSLDRPGYCDLYWEPPTSAPKWTEYLELRARRSLEDAGEEFACIDATALAQPFDAEPERGFLHFDCYPQNILVEGDRVVGVVDFGGMCMCGDPRFDPLTAAIYPGAGIRSEDRLGVRESCREWLSIAGLLPWLDAAELVVAAIWSFAQDDPVVEKWSRRVLLNKVD